MCLSQAVRLRKGPGWRHCTSPITSDVSGCFCSISKNMIICEFTRQLCLHPFTNLLHHNILYRYIYIDLYTLYICNVLHASEFIARKLPGDEGKIQPTDICPARDLCPQLIGFISGSRHGPDGPGCSFRLLRLLRRNQRSLSIIQNHDISYQ